MGAPGWSVMKLDQIHSGIVCDIDDTGPASEPMEGDAAVTSLQGVMLGIQTADCAPILIADREARAVGAVHAGWRGTALRIVESTIARIAEKFTIRPGDLTAAIGPHIGVCCYEVGEDVIAAIRGAAIFERRRDWEKPHLNLAEAARRQLLNAGVPEEQIETSSLCTRCRADLFFSYRREGTRTGRLLSVIGIVP
jgi:YfiH family protein